MNGGWNGFLLKKTHTALTTPKDIADGTNWIHVQIYIVYKIYSVKYKTNLFSMAKEEKQEKSTHRIQISLYT